MIEINEIFPLYVTSNLAELKDYYGVHFGFNAVFFDESFYLEPAISINEEKWLEEHPIHPELNVQEAFLTSIKKIETENTAEPASFEIETRSHVTDRCLNLCLGNAGSRLAAHRRRDRADSGRVDRRRTAAVGMTIVR